MTIEYFLPTRLVFGNEAIGRLPALLASTFPKARSLLLITGKNHLRRQGNIDRVLKVLETYDIFLFDEVEAGPTAETLKAAQAREKECRPDVVIGIGGGSVLDLAKAVAILAKNQGTLAEYQQGRLMERDGLPFIAVPTTTGTASEMTVWSVITNTEGNYAGRRKSFSDPRMYPALAIIDPELTITLSPQATVGTALDILSASVESLWSKRKNPISDVFAAAAIRELLSALPAVVRDPLDPALRERLCLASLHCGFAVSNSRTGAPHKVSYPLSTHFGLPHGAACALTLPGFTRAFGKRSKESIQTVLDALDAKTPDEAADRMTSFLQSLGAATRLRDVGVTEAALPLIVQESYVPPEEQTDPVPLSRDEFETVLRELL